VDSETQHACSKRHSHKNLVARSRPARTFAGLAAFTALVFLCCGIYLIAQPLVDPVAAHDAGTVAGAFILALASILLFYLVKPDSSGRTAQLGQRREEDERAHNGMTLKPAHLRRTRIRASLD